MGRRSLLLAAALLFAAIGTALVYGYVRTIDGGTQGGDSVRVFVATRFITPGSTLGSALESGAVTTQSRPASQVPGSAALTTSRSQVFAQQVAPGLTIVETMLSTSAPTDLKVTIPRGKAIIDLALQDPDRLAGLLAPGAHVAILFVPSRQNGQANADVRVLLNYVRVVSVGPSTNKPASTADQAPPAAVGVALSQAEIVSIRGIPADNLSFALLADCDTKTMAVGAVSDQTDADSDRCKNAGV